MGSPHAELRRVLKKLKALTGAARCIRAADADRDRTHCAELQATIAEVDRLRILGAHAHGAAKLTAEAVALLEACDPLANLRAIKLDYFDRLASTCDDLMRAGQMPDAAYLQALASAACDYEIHHCAGADIEHLAFAWDLLAQAEAGLGAPTDQTHYARAEHRYGRRSPVQAPALALVAGTAG